MDHFDTMWLTALIVWLIFEVRELRNSLPGTSRRKKVGSPSPTAQVERQHVS